MELHEKLLEVKKAVFYVDQIIILKRSRKILIERNNIKVIKYRKPSLISFLGCAIAPGCSIFPGRLEIWLHNEVDGRIGYFLKIRYADAYKIRDAYCMVSDIV